MHHRMKLFQPPDVHDDRPVDAQKQFGIERSESGGPARARWGSIGTRR
jgi:hypothetical protein